MPSTNELLKTHQNDSQEDNNYNKKKGKSEGARTKDVPKFIPSMPSKSKRYQSLKNIKKTAEEIASNAIDVAVKMRWEFYGLRWPEVLKNGKNEFNEKWENPPKNSAELDDFRKIRTLGNGSFGRVILVKDKIEEKLFAIKIMAKKEIFNLKQVEHTLNEKKILATTSFPFLVSLAFSFKDNANLFLGLEFVSGGEMFSLLNKLGCFTEEVAKFYISQIVLGIEYLHSLDILHRDLKPENTLITSNGYVKITDFGFAKMVKTRTFTFCGTPEYLAPEILSSTIYGKPVDWWAVGILTYEMVAGFPPFHGDRLKMYEKISRGEFRMLKKFTPELQDFLKNMIELDITKRFGTLRNGVNDIKKHAWMSSIDWWDIYKKNVTPTIIPKFKSGDDGSNFDLQEEKEIEQSRDELYPKEFEQF
jgi:protein kinase A